MSVTKDVTDLWEGIERVSVVVAGKEMTGVAYKYCPELLLANYKKVNKLGKIVNKCDQY